MIADLRPYPAYKDSGVPWLGEVPAHWEVRRLRNAVETRVSNVDKLTKEGEFPVRLCNYVNVYKNDRITEGLAFMRATATPEELERFRLQAGDVLITKDSEMWNDIGVPALVEYIASDLVCGYHLALLRRRRGHMIADYLLRALQSPGVSYQFHVSANGVTRYGLSHDAIKTVLLPIPPLDEQAAIVRYLDYMDRRIRRYIRAKQKLIALLNEQKQAIIHQAVTRGLDPNVRFKPSGEEWLGEVPEHWEVRQLGRFITLQRGFDITKEQQTHGSVPVVSSGGISSYHNQATSSGPGVVVGRKGSAGTVHYLDGAFWAHDTTLWVKAFNGNHPRYVYYVLCHLDLKRFDTGSANPTINRNIVHPEIVPFPPPGEQRTIASFLDTMLDKNGKMIDDAGRQIALLREYRTRLIADVVTGKLDVRAAAAALPEEDGEPEALEEAAPEEVEGSDEDSPESEEGEV